MIALPDIIEERIVNLNNENKVNTETLRAEYREIFSDSFIQNDPQFATDSQRHHYAIKVLIARARAVKPDTAASKRQKADDCSK